MTTTQKQAAEPFISPKAAAELLPISERTLANWRSHGEGPPFIKVGGRVGYRVSDIERWLEQHTAGTSTGSRRPAP